MTFNDCTTAPTAPKRVVRTAQQVQSCTYLSWRPIEIPQTPAAALSLSQVGLVGVSGDHLRQGPVST